MEPCLWWARAVLGWAAHLTYYSRYPSSNAGATMVLPLSVVTAATPDADTARRTRRPAPTPPPARQRFHRSLPPQNGAVIALPLSVTTAASRDADTTCNTLCPLPPHAIASAAPFLCTPVLSQPFL
ncbi:hypothetical protein [Oryza sativa Japonica Group]|uniref:Uncharacterized protein n=1 Tax=Oryza sativa subsp. japonica TaxID=39947 RepID=Q5ZCQ8_ORYSJ|nr:hypothetical protein [Oryza sativa Japonica Group]BAD52751.1 hypothetical protein [Oryza sativa Japonica Group]